MDSFVFSLNSTIPIFLVMIIGYVIRRLGIVDEHFATVANRYVFKVSLPVLLFRDLSTADFKADFDLKFVLFCFIVTFLMFSLTWLFTEIIMKDDSMKGAFVQASCRSSAAILGIAFIENIYADAGMAPLMIVAAVPLFNIFAVIILTFKAHPELQIDRFHKSDIKAKYCVNSLSSSLPLALSSTPQNSVRRQFKCHYTCNTQKLFYII